MQRPTDFSRSLPTLFTMLLCLLLCLWRTSPAAADDLLKAKPEVQALLNAGSKLLPAGKYEEALALFLQAQSKAQELKDKKGESASLRGQGYVYIRTYRLPQSLQAYQQALPLTQEIGDKPGEANALDFLGVIYYKMGQLQKALEYYTNALSLYKDQKNENGEGGTMVNLGSVYAALGQEQEALNFYLQALPIVRSAKNIQYEANALHNLANIYVNRGQWQKALDAYIKILPVFQSIKDVSGEAQALSGIGTIYRDTGQWGLSLEYFRKAMLRYQSIGDKSGESDEFSDIGSVYLYMDQYPQALEAYQQALSLFEQLDNKVRIGSTLNSIGIVLYNTHQYVEALKYSQRALPLLQPAGDKALEAYALKNIGSILSQTHHPQEALDNYHRALDIFRACHRLQNVSVTLSVIADLEVKQNQLEAASLHYNQALDQIEEIRTNLGAYSEAKSRYMLLQLPTYYRSIQLSLRLHHEEQAFARVQQTKARGLLDLMASGNVDLSHDLTPEERQEEQELRERADFLNQQMLRESMPDQADAKHSDQLQKQLLQIESRLQILTDSLYARHPALAGKRVARAATLEEVGRALPTDTALLEYVLTSPQQITLFVIRNKAGKATLQVFALPLNYKHLKQETIDFHVACADPNRPYQTLARSLYKQLLAPAGEALRGAKRLVVCPDQALWYVPFAALLIDGGQAFVNDRYELAYAYSATGLLAAQHLRSDPNRPHPTGTMLALANPNTGDISRFHSPEDKAKQPEKSIPNPLDTSPLSAHNSLPELPTLTQPPPADADTFADLLRGNRLTPLPGAQQEADALRRLFPDAAIYTGAQAQESLVKQEAGKYRYLHFAAHGFYNNTYPMLSSIVLAQPPKESHEDGLLTAREFSELHLNADLVTLSACDTARGEYRSGEGVIGLSWALLVAGCPSQVVSQWQVEDTCTAQLMANFYTGLKAGGGKAASLQKAEQKLSRDSKHAHPYFWAPFCLIGDWR